MDTSMKILKGSPLELAANKVLEAAQEYWDIYQKTVSHGAVIYLEDEGGRILVFTRGEYYATLMQNISRVLTEAEAMQDLWGAWTPRECEQRVSAMKKIESAVAHAEHVAQTCEDVLCRLEHRDLARWLTELLEYKLKEKAR